MFCVPGKIFFFLVLSYFFPLQFLSFLSYAFAVDARDGALARHRLVLFIVRIIRPLRPLRPRLRKHSAPDDEPDNCFFFHALVRLRHRHEAAPSRLGELGEGSHFLLAMETVLLTRPGLSFGSY